MARNGHLRRAVSRVSGSGFGTLGWHPSDSDGSRDGCHWHFLEIMSLTHLDERQRAVLISAYSYDEGWPPEQSLAELERLASTAGVEVVATAVQRVRAPQRASYLRRGRVCELKEEKSSLGFNMVIADDELSAAQQRYLEAALDVDVLDRTALILHIFAQHARTREGRLQVELAQYRYRLPRLTGHGVALSRLGAGINTRGPGESKLETDRRRIRHRISELDGEIEQVRKQRSLLRRQRRLSGIPVVALTGYTNAGKSTLMNALTGSEVVSSDQLFATLDPTTRRLRLLNGQEILLTDTVGFIQKLPSDLVAAFRATLEEVTEADVIVHVVDASHPQIEEQAEAVEDELEELDVASQPRITVLNKVDLVSPDRLAALSRRLRGAVPVSARRKTGFGQLQAVMMDCVAREFVEVTVEIPYTESELVGIFRSRGMVEREAHEPDGTMIKGRLPSALLPSFRPYLS